MWLSQLSRTYYNHINSTFSWINPILYFQGILENIYFNLLAKIKKKKIPPLVTLASNDLTLFCSWGQQTLYSQDSLFNCEKANVKIGFFKMEPKCASLSFLVLPSWPEKKKEAGSGYRLPFLKEIGLSSYDCFLQHPLFLTFGQENGCSEQSRFSCKFHLWVSPWFHLIQRINFTPPQFSLMTPRFHP